MQTESGTHNIELRTMNALTAIYWAAREQQIIEIPGVGKVDDLYFDGTQIMTTDNELEKKEIIRKTVIAFKFLKL